MMQEQIKANLDNYAKLQFLAEAIRIRYREERWGLLADIQPRLDELDSAEAEELAPLESQLTDIKANIESGVRDVAETVKGQHLMAVYSKGRTMWDTRGLNGYAAAHPEIVRFRKIGKPSVTIRTVKS